ncbi:hypothetical protein M9Y10_029533 [Tritrichomonas musculus]|uniref:Protein kinase domain-containing protein n=1 Tax=Tritrichomonas musculus TaxID=1915356 RepID=A0ABR2KNA0_9EUKA
MPQVKTNKTLIKEIVQNYNFIHISKNSKLEEKERQIIIQNIKESEILIFDKSETLNTKKKDKYLIIGFENTIIIVDESSSSLITSINPEISAFYLYDNKDENFNQEIENLTKAFNIIKGSKSLILLWSLITPCISGYLIKKGYLQRNKYRIERYIKDLDNNEKPQNISQDEYVDLRMTGFGGAFNCALIYHIKQNELCVIKRPYENDRETPKLLKREGENYSKIKHPLLPKFYGKVKDTNCIIIEFINGHTLKFINKLELTFNDKINIVFELMLIIKYFHDNKMIYRDLKPDNVIIDVNKTVVLIDFDRLIEIEITDTDTTLDLGSNFIAPEVADLKKFSYKSDIYSLGKMIEYVMNSEKYESTQSDEYLKIKELWNKCLNETPEKRPSISHLIKEFTEKYQSKIQFELLSAKYIEHFVYFDMINEIVKKKNQSETHFSLGFLYYEGIYVQQDIDKAIHYFSLSANQNHIKAQFNLGIIYYNGDHVQQNIVKAINYLSQAADSNHPVAQFNLATIYYDGKYIQKDIDKAIHYFSLAAKQNHPDSLLNLGIIYYNIQQDINKAIHYFSIAANQNHPKALFNLGTIYYEGKYITRDINKAIYYYSMASDLNDEEAQLNLGFIYYKGQYVPRDINKSIHYFQLAAKQNIIVAQVNLGVIYYEGKLIERDMNKAIHYFSLAANQNDLQTQMNLGAIYYEGKLIERDINKAIHYFTLASNQNSPKAQYYLGIVYCDGKYLMRDINKAIHYFSLAAKKNHVEAQFQLGFIYSEGQYISRDINQAIYYYSLAANQNHKNAQFNIGTIYYEGKHIQQNINKAIHYFSLAAKQNHLKAQFNLGVIFSDGKYVTLDIEKAIYYYSIAADQNHPEAQINLGFLYYKGKFIPRDINKAIHYFSLAATQNYPHAKFILGDIFYHGIYVARDINKAIYYYSMAANQNHPNAQANLGHIYYDGKYISKDINKSIHYFTLAANQNFLSAQLNLAIIFYEGMHVIQDIKKSIHYFTLAASQHYPQAQYYLALIYYFSEYVARDVNKAIHYFSLAANNNHPEAQLDLGILYYMQKDIKKGIYYIMLSSKNGNKQANFSHGFLLHEGKNIKKNLEDAIHLYKEASSFNNQYAKNNLGIIYKNGCDEIQQNSGKAIEYFREAIHQKNDILSMYNLAHLYIYDEEIKLDFSRTVGLLIKSANNFHHSMVLLCLLLIKHCGFDIEIIKQKINEHINHNNDFTAKLCQMISGLELFNTTNFDFLYESYRKKVFLYNILLAPIPSTDLQNIDGNDIRQKYSNIKDISSEFYNGFGYLDDNNF